MVCTNLRLQELVQTLSLESPRPGKVNKVYATRSEPESPEGGTREGEQGQGNCGLEFVWERRNLTEKMICTWGARGPKWGKWVAGHFSVGVAKS